jgi:hypothetical protein
MKPRRTRQMQLTFATEAIIWFAKEKQQEVVNALAELLLAAANGEDDDEGRHSDERQDHD